MQRDINDFVFGTGAALAGWGIGSLLPASGVNASLMIGVGFGAVVCSIMWCALQRPTS